MLLNIYFNIVFDMKINLDLQCINSVGTGIAEFAKMLIGYLQNQPEYELYGYMTKFNHSKGIIDLSNYRFPIKIGYWPISLVYSKKLKTPLPIYYHWLCSHKADINISFTWNIKRVRHHGLTIATIHDLIALRTEMESQEIVNNQLNDLSYTLANCDYIITVSESSKNDIVEEFHYPAERIVVIPNGIDFNYFNTPITNKKSQQIKTKYNLPDKFILYLGGMRKHKNIERLIKAYSILSNGIKDKYKLVITKGTPELRSLVNKLHLQDNVIFTKYIDDEDKPGLYQLSSLYAYISLYEGFGIPVIEAQAAGTPVITSNTSSLPEVASDSAACVDPTDVKGISKTIERILTDNNYRTLLVTKGYENALKYSPDKAGEKFCEFLNSIKKKCPNKFSK